MINSQNFRIIKVSSVQYNVLSCWHYLIWFFSSQTLNANHAKLAHDWKRVYVSRHHWRVRWLRNMKNLCMTKTCLWSGVIMQKGWARRLGVESVGNRKSKILMICACLWPHLTYDRSNIKKVGYNVWLCSGMMVFFWREFACQISFAPSIGLWSLKYESMKVWKYDGNFSACW